MSGEFKEIDIEGLINKLLTFTSASYFQAMDDLVVQNAPDALYKGKYTVLDV
jgi:hypothetical protein